MVIAALSTIDVLHEKAIAAIVARRETRQSIRISTVSIAELHSIRGVGRNAQLASVRRFVDSLGVDGVVDVDRQTAETAGEARSRRPSLRLADSMIKATADRIGAELLTADRQLAKLNGVTLLG